MGTEREERDHCWGWFPVRSPFRTVASYYFKWEPLRNGRSSSLRQVQKYVCLQPNDETHFFFLLGVTFRPVGCFKDGRNRAMPQLLKNFRTIPGGIDWFDLSKVVRKCADEAMNRRKSQ